MKIFKEIAVLGFLVGLLSIPAFSQTAKIDIDALIAETQKLSPTKDEMTIVWWIPTEFWRVTLAEENLTKAQIEEFIGVLRPYILVAVVDGKIADDGKVKYRTESAILSDIRIVGSGKGDLAPLSPDKVGPGMTAVLKTMKPIVSNVLGSLGTNLHFVVFPSSDATGGQIADPSRGGSFGLRLGPNRTFTWRLPLAALTPPKVCPIDGEKLPANWKYCPYHGAELKNQ